jgi:hypothetical protein
MQLEIDGNNLMFVLTNFASDGNHYTNAGNAMVKRSNIVGALFIANDFGSNPGIGRRGSRSRGQLPRLRGQIVRRRGQLIRSRGHLTCRSGQRARSRG